jgi:hypothetical protein
MKTLVVRSWNGTSRPHELMYVDVAPEFDLMTFDYSGGARLDAGSFPWASEHLYLSRATECKGQIYLEVSQFMKGELAGKYAYIGLIDDDIILSVSGINTMLFLAKVHGLDSFAAALSRDSVFSHEFSLQVPGFMLRSVPWVEIMMPFYRTQLFLEAESFYPHTISGYGIDCYVMPLMCRQLNMRNVALIDAVAARHVKPVTSSSRRYSNGLTAMEELEQIHLMCLAWEQSQEAPGPEVSAPVIWDDPSGRR